MRSRVRSARHIMDAAEEARLAFASLNELAGTNRRSKSLMQTIHVLPASSSERSCAWHKELVTALDAFGSKTTFQDADIVLPGIDLLVPHYPSFLWECRRWPGGHANFAQERCQRMAEFWLQLVPALRPRLSSQQRLLLFDVRAPTAAPPTCPLAHQHIRTYTHAPFFSRGC